MVTSRQFLFLGFFIWMSDGNIYRMLGIAATTFTGFLVMLYVTQENMLYRNDQHPEFKTPQRNPATFKHPGERGMKYRDIYFRTPDGLKLHSWFIQAPEDVEDPRTIIFFHANAGNMGFRLPNIEKMYKHVKCNIMILSYRGYGNSEGAPSESGLIIDGITTMKYVYQNAADLGVNLKKLFIFGRSLGGAVAVQVAAEYHEKIGGLILENTFTSIGDLVDTLFPFLSYPALKNYMLRLKWETKLKISKITCPILFLEGKEDEVIPHEHMKKLFQLATSAKFKKEMVIEDGMHNDTWMKGGEAYWDLWREFVEDQRCSK